MLSTNVSSIVRMTTSLVPYLETNAPGGGIMLVSSMAGITPPSAGRFATQLAVAGSLFAVILLFHSQQSLDFIYFQF